MRPGMRMATTAAENVHGRMRRRRLPDVAVVCPMWTSSTRCGCRLPDVDVVNPMWMSSTRCGCRLPDVDVVYPIWPSSTRCGRRLPDDVVLTDGSWTMRVQTHARRRAWKTVRGGRGLNHRRLASRHALDKPSQSGRWINDAGHRSYYCGLTMLARRHALEKLSQFGRYVHVCRRVHEHHDRPQPDVCS